ncbi:hypothetical protein [Marinobacter sp. F3R08]|uniref:hypothetical protein n=1 Tax=Marinobacter sp. F3R08 TaxID=2841559 RepID=UPI001C09C8F4|nr:hypothetical protein [Marinobacter sp. F3R08]MBU2954378.1 hypothetical protein [Marinobacter sp. F3R08]
MVSLVVLVVFFLRRKHGVERKEEATSLKKRSEARRHVPEKNKGMPTANDGVRGPARIKALRQYMDTMNDDLTFISAIHPTANGAPKGEWVIAPGAHPTAGFSTFTVSPGSPAAPKATVRERATRCRK